MERACFAESPPSPPLRVSRYLLPFEISRHPVISPMHSAAIPAPSLGAYVRGVARMVFYEANRERLAPLDVASLMRAHLDLVIGKGKTT